MNSAREESEKNPWPRSPSSPSPSRALSPPSATLSLSLTLSLPTPKTPKTQTSFSPFLHYRFLSTALAFCVVEYMGCHLINPNAYVSATPPSGGPPSRPRRSDGRGFRERGLHVEREREGQQKVQKRRFATIMGDNGC